MNTFRILEGDARKLLAGLEPDSVQTCVTSPPYWGLRDYKVAGQLGLEKTPEEYVQAMGDIFDEVKRVLRPDGTLWVNMGDSYASQGKNRTEAQAQAKSGLGRGHATRNQTSILIQQSKIVAGLKAKDLVGMPWMLAFELRRRGWFLRQDIIWSKPNPMPESVTDRCTKAHEYLFMLSKSSRYYFDQDAIKEPAVDSEGRGGGHSIQGAGVQQTRGQRTGQPGRPGYADSWSGGGGTQITPQRTGQHQEGPGVQARTSRRATDAATRDSTSAGNREGGGERVPAGWDTSRGRGGHGNFHRDGRQAPTERQARWLRWENQCAARARGLPGSHRLPKQARRVAHCHQALPRGPLRHLPARAGGALHPGRVTTGRPGAGSFQRGGHHWPGGAAPRPQIPGHRAEPGIRRHGSAED